MIALTLSTLLSLATRAAAQTQLRHNQDLWNCARDLSDLPVSMRFLARKFSRFSVTDLPDFAGTRFSNDNERADGQTYAVPDASLPRRLFSVTRIDPQFYLSEVGFKNLEADAKAVNRFVARRLLNGSESSITFRNSPERTQALRTLHGLRWGFHSKVLDTYRGHRSMASHLKDEDYERLIEAIQHDNSDVLGITEKFINPNGGATAIRAQLLMSLQVSYDQPRDFLFPSLDGMLEATGESALSARRLPFMARLAPDRRDEFIEWFWATFGHLRTCEIARLIKKRGVPDVVEARLFREALWRVIDRGCQAIVASQGGAVHRLLQEYGFRVVRPIPTGKAKRENLVFLDVSSIGFWDSYRRLSRRLGQLDF